MNVRYRCVGVCVFERVAVVAAQEAAIGLRSVMRAAIGLITDAMLSGDGLGEELKTRSWKV